MRSAVAAALSAEDGLQVVAQAEDAGSATRATATSRPDVAVVSLHLPPDGGLAVCRGLAAQPDAPRVLVLSREEEHAGLVQSLEAGASGYLAADANLGDLVLAVRALGRGEAVVPPRMLGGLLHDLVLRRRQQGAAHERWGTLSRREREVLALLARGLDQERIAAELVISPQTARTHIQNVMGKLKVHSRVEAVAVALEHGLLEVS